MTFWTLEILDTLDTLDKVDTLDKIGKVPLISKKLRKLMNSGVAGISRGSTPGSDMPSALGLVDHKYIIFSGFGEKPVNFHIKKSRMRRVRI